MKIYLIDPNKKWCKANLHCHTTLSDGNFTPEEIKKYYQEQGYQIVAFTDHEVFYDNSYLCDENFVALTAAEYSFNPHEGELAYYSYPQEGMSWRDMETVHMCVIKPNPHDVFHFFTSKENFNGNINTDVEPILDRRGDKVEFDGNRRWLTIESMNQFLEEANKRGCLVQYNHPNWSLNTRETYLKLKGLWSLEIFNYLTEIETGAEYCPYVYDDMLRSGMNLFCSMGDDNHNFGKSFEGSFGGFNYVGVDELTYDNVFSSLKKGDFYASMGPIIKYMYIDTDEGKIYLECSEAVDIVFVGYNRTFRHYAGENLTKADFKIFGGEVYFRIAIKDKEGKWANTHVYFLKDFNLA